MRIRAGVLLILVALGLAAAPAGAAKLQTPDDSPGFIDIIEVAGLFDPIIVSFIETSIAQSEANGARYLVIHVNSSGTVADNDDILALATYMQHSRLPIGIWVGPSGAEFTGTAAQLLGVVDSVGVSIGSRIGNTGPQILPEADFGVLFGEYNELLSSSTIGSERSLEYGLVEADAPTLGEFAITLPGFVTQEVTQDGRTVLEPRTTVRFAELDLIDQIFHSVASPPVTYLLFGIGFVLIVFELFTAAIGIAGIVGAALLIVSSYGIWVLPVRPWAVALVVLSFFAFAADLQIGVPRAWTFLGFAMFGLGTIGFYDGLSMSWITWAGALLGVVFLFMGGIPTLVRSRFSTPVIGRAWLVGEIGFAEDSLAPSGIVVLQGAPWRAKVADGGVIRAGEGVTVVSVDGMYLEVEARPTP